MANIVKEVQKNAFVQGLITEASPLTFPPNASLDEQNFNLELNGSRSRRLGIDYEVGYTLTNTGLSNPVLQNTRQSVSVWPFPGGSSTIILGVIRVYNRLYFIDLLTANPSANLKNQGNYITISALVNAEIQTTVVNGYFVFTSEDLPLPILLSYNKDTDVVSQETIAPLVRDLDGLDDTYVSDFRPITLTDKHKYNLINQGWSGRITSTCSTGVYTTYGALGSDPVVHPAIAIGALECTKTTLGVYPSNSDVWSLGKKENAYDATTTANLGKYDPELMARNAIDIRTPIRGSFILGLFSRGADRSNLSGIVGLPLDREEGRITTITSYAGRVFYSGIKSRVTGGDIYSPNYSGYIFFSQVARTKEKFSNCYQANDPTNPDISDLLDTDGGTIHIPEASNITKLVATSRSLLVFAENGIWEISGENAGFIATAYQISKVTGIGVSNPNTVVDTGGTIVYWAKTGIHAISPDPTTGRYSTENISLTTIQTFYNSIPDIAKLNARGFYDERLNTVRWIYNDSGTYSETNYINHYTKQLNLSLTLKAFYTYSISSLISGSPFITDFVQVPGYSLTGVNFDVYASADQVITTGNTIITTGKNNTSRSGTYNYLTFTGSSFTVSKYSNTTFLDWKTANSVGVDYSSYLLTGYEILGDIAHIKQVPYVVFYLSRTEDGFTQVGSDLVIDNPSSCLVQAQWDWCDSLNSGKWGVQFQAYRLLRPYIPSGAGDTFDYGDSVITTKNKLRGSGRALSLKIQSEAGKDMKLLGWSMDITGRAKV